MVHQQSEAAVLIDCMERELKKIEGMVEFLELTSPFSLESENKYDVTHLLQAISECRQALQMCTQTHHQVLEKINLMEEEQKQVIAYFANCEMAEKEKVKTLDDRFSGLSCRLAHLGPSAASATV